MAAQDQAGGSGRKPFSRGRIIAGAVVALAVLAVLAVAALMNSGGPGPRASTASTASKNKAVDAGKAPPGIQAYPGGANPDPSAHPGTIAGPPPPSISAALMQGRPSAPVTVVEFGDYQCINCGAFARDTEPTLLRKYVDTGVVRLEWRDFPWVDAQSVAAAVAARAAGAQGKFWAYHDYLYAHQSSNEHSGLVTAGYLRTVARHVGLNMAEFERASASPALAKAVRADKLFGEALGVPGTPAFLIGGRTFFGNQPLSAFEAAIARARSSQ